ncbi:hypothetical protein SPBR_08525 [Sporothrix brasiliensis 5110]|uniref:Uncharacterized protein n=1 Tax=Sporothrix brasiliensis 5110 TaxID=1398154 RepID=A0A0C2IIR5_9PEZI|nr:uncharacterized protein SPBR_08525 [Sporothrix brasiliensis 5110]KIH86890.1 hypothetical protein SPBR_08525 [Sporothrix brasiliensis 5110]
MDYKDEKPIVTVHDIVDDYKVAHSKIATANPITSPILFCRQLVKRRREAKNEKARQEGETKIAKSLSGIREAIFESEQKCHILVRRIEDLCGNIGMRTQYLHFAVVSLLPPSDDAGYRGSSTAEYQALKAAKLRSMTEQTQAAFNAVETAVGFIRAQMNGVIVLVDEACAGKLFVSPFGDQNPPSLYPNGRTRPRMVRRDPSKDGCPSQFVKLREAVLATATTNSDWNIPDAQYDLLHAVHRQLKKVQDAHASAYGDSMAKRTIHGGFRPPPGGWWSREYMRSAATVLNNLATRMASLQAKADGVREALVSANAVREATAAVIKQELASLGPACTVIPKQLEPVDMRMYSICYDSMQSVKWTKGRTHSILQTAEAMPLVHTISYKPQQRGVTK